MESETKVECPVCSRLYTSLEISQHVDECLKNQDQSFDQDVIVEKSETRSENRKRKSDSPHKSGWGFLKASSSSTSKKSKVDKNISEIPKKNVKMTKMPNMPNPTEHVNANGCKNVQNSKISNPTGSKSSMSTTSTHSQNMSDVNCYPNRIDNNQGIIETSIDPFKPLAEQMRPTSFNDYIGHEKEVGGSTMLGKLLQSDTVPSMVLWGPPGCGKTTLARVIASNCKKRGCAKFVQLSAAAAGVNDVKEVVKIAKNDKKMFHKKTILFLDEIHRFNKTQQDALLPHVEDGTITLIGATTENPSFQVNSALLSRCRVIVLDKLSAEAVEEILLRAVKRLGVRVLDEGDEVSEEDKDSRNMVLIEKKAVETLSHLCDGDARVALNGLQMAIQSQTSKISQSKDSLPPCLKQTNRITKSIGKSEKELGKNVERAQGNEGIADRNGKVDKHARIVRTEHIKEGLQKSHLLYDRAGEEHYNIISALHKSMRGSDDSAALYWLARMLEGGETPLYVARRLVRFASEDIGLADPLALNQSVAAYQACHFIGMPECEVILAQCVVYLSRAPKSIEVYQAYSKAKQCVRSHQGPLPSVPLHLRNAPTKLMKDLGYSKGYKYNPSFSEPVDQEYFPEGLKGTNFFK